MTQNQWPSGEKRPEFEQASWELQRRQRMLLNRRVRAIRRSLVVGGVVGTVAFSALAGYETQAASSSASTTPTEQPASTQSSGASFFADQATSTLGPATPTATATPGVNIAATSTARAKAAATATARAGLAASETADAAATETAEADAAATETAEANAAATETAEAIPTDTPTPVVEEETQPAPPQRASRSQSSS